MTLEIAGWTAAFVAGLALGAAPWVVRRLQRRGGAAAAGDAPCVRRWPLVVVTAVVTLLLAGTGAYFALRVLLRPEPVRSASHAGALEAFRGSGCATPAAAAGGEAAPAMGETFGPPAPGVYTYRAAGRFDLSAPVFGTDHRKLEGSVPATVLIDGARWSWAVQVFEKRVETTEFLVGPGRQLAAPRFVTDDVHFRIGVRSTMVCEPGVMLPADAALGASWDRPCISHTDALMGTTHEMPTTATLVGLELVPVGDERVPAYRVREETKVGGGDQAGRITRETWFAADDGLPLRVVHDSRTGGMADNLEEYTFELVSRTPQR
ncbi:MAG: hypothetical protein JXB32_05555 [Deltaproteobacteria bacterium]|nr:hypothetical protein [Deltaproteobacteria bacterium]